MALRTSSLPSSTASPTPALDWRVRVQQTVAGAAAAIAAGDLDRLATSFAELSEWDDAHRAYQARRVGHLPTREGPPKAHRRKWPISPLTRPRSHNEDLA